jgi:hypothetical protein
MHRTSNARRRLPIAAALALPLIGGVASAGGVVGAEAQPRLVDDPGSSTTTAAAPIDLDGVTIVGGADKPMALTLSRPAVAEPTVAPMETPVPAVAAPAPDVAAAAPAQVADAPVSAPAREPRARRAQQGPAVSIVEVAGVDGVPVLSAYAAFWDAGYDYETLLRLAEEWQLPEFDAKARAGAAIVNGDAAVISQIDAAAAAATTAPAAESPSNPDELYFAENMREWRAMEELAAEWQIEVIDVKARLGAMPTAEADRLVGRR